MELETADVEAGMAAGNMEAEWTGAVAETAAAADTKVGYEGSGMVVAGSRVAAAAAGGEDFAGYNMESGPVDHIHRGLVVHKEESVGKERTHFLALTLLDEER